MLIPEMQVDDSVARKAKRAIGKHDLTVQLAKGNSKNAIRFVSILEYPLPTLQPSIEDENKLRPKRPLAADQTLAPLIHRWERK